MNFFLGVHHANWLALTNVPLFVSARSLLHRRTLPRAAGDWCMDSMGFNELRQHGRYTLAARSYSALAVRCASEVGGLVWAAVQDWMCEPAILSRTGLSVREHQERTIESLLDLAEFTTEIAWIPILQGWTEADYLRHVEMYDRRGFDLRTAPVVGLGSVCTRQSTGEITHLVRRLHSLGLKLHGFGMKMLGVVRCRDWLASSDSMAWSLDGRYPDGGRCQRVRSHKSCANCLAYALRWRERLIGKLSQLSLGLAA